LQADLCCAPVFEKCLISLRWQMVCDKETIIL
jgi:hypothetical protein